MPPTPANRSREPWWHGGSSNYGPTGRPAAADAANGSRAAANGRPPSRSMTSGASWPGGRRYRQDRRRHVGRRIDVRVDPDAVMEVVELLLVPNVQRTLCSELNPSIAKHLRCSSHSHVGRLTAVVSLTCNKRAAGLRSGEPSAFDDGRADIGVGDRHVAEFVSTVDVCALGFDRLRCAHGREKFSSLQPQSVLER